MDIQFLYTMCYEGELWFVTDVSLSSMVPGSRLLRGKSNGSVFCSNICFFTLIFWSLFLKWLQSPKGEMGILLFITSPGCFMNWWISPFRSSYLLRWILSRIRSVAATRSPSRTSEGVLGQEERQAQRRENHWVHYRSRRFWGLVVRVASVPEIVFVCPEMSYTLSSELRLRPKGLNPSLREAPSLTFTRRQRQHPYSVVCVDEVHATFVESDPSTPVFCHPDVLVTWQQPAPESDWDAWTMAVNSRDSQGSRKNPSWLPGLSSSREPRCWCLHSFTRHSAVKENS